VQADERAKGLVGHALARAHDGEAQLGVDGIALRAFEFDLQPGAFRRGGVVEQFGQLDTEPGGDRAEEGEARLPATVLHERELAAGHPDIGAELFERQACPRAEMPHPLPQGHKILHEMKHTERSPELSRGIACFMPNRGAPWS
jgi:hypothetical protein